MIKKEYFNLTSEYLKNHYKWHLWTMLWFWVLVWQEYLYEWVWSVIVKCYECCGSDHVQRFYVLERFTYYQAF